MECRIDIRIKTAEKTLIKRLAKMQYMNVTEYIKYRLFEQNPALTKIDYLYECPANDRYHYTLMGITQQSQEILKVILTHLKGEASKNIISDSLSSAVDILEKKYNYKKIKLGDDE